MDGNSISQSSELTEHVRHKKRSSILKAPRSPLKDLGSGNEICQEPIIEKRRKSSRRVSFAETIRVFRTELQSTGSADKENEGFETSGPGTSINKGTADKFGIAGMDTLLHGAIQGPSHNADVDWNYADCTKDRTILFAVDNDLDITANNTIAINGLIEEKFKKMDTSQVLANLKSSDNEVAQNKDSVLSVGVEKDSDFIFKRDSSMENKINFSDFLTSLKSEKSKVTNILEGAEKENFLPSVSTHFHTLDNTENFTHIFREQDDGLNLTKCHTTNMVSFFQMANTANHLSSSDKVSSQPERIPLSEFSHLISMSNNLTRSNNQTVFIEDDMDITRNHTTCIRQDTPAQNVQLPTYQNETQFPSDETVIFDKANAMEVTTDISVFLNKNPSVTAVQGEERVFCVDHTTILPQGEDMDVTKSHTECLTVEQVKPQAMAHSAVCSDVANDLVRLSSGLSLHSQIVPRKSLNNIDGPDGHNTTYTSKLEFKPEDTVGQVNKAEQNKAVSTFSNLEPIEKMLGNHKKSANNERKSYTVAIDGKPLQDLSKKDNKSYMNCLKLPSLSNKTILFSTDDPELTQSHTVFDQKAMNRGNTNNISLEFHQRDTSVSTSRHVEKTDIGLRVTENTALINKTTGAVGAKPSVMNATSLLSDDVKMSVIGNDGFGISTPSNASAPKMVTNPNTVCSERETTHNVLKWQLHNETVSQVGDMEMTTVNADLLIAARKSQSWNKVNPSFESFKDTTMYLCDQDDMDMTRVHTVAIRNELIAANDANLKSGSQNSATVGSKSHLNDVKCIPRPHSVHDLDKRAHTSWIQADPEMDITVANTVNINSEKPGNDLHLPITKSNVLPSTRSQYFDSKENAKGNDLVFDQESRNHLETNTSVFVELQDKTSFLYEQNDMDITRSHTKAVESKILEALKNKKVYPEFQNTQQLTKRNVVPDLTNNGINMADDLTPVNGACFKGEDMDMTKSNTGFIGDIFDKLHTKDIHVSDILSRSKTVSSLQKSIVGSDETQLVVCNMEETNTNVHLSESLGNRSSFDKTTCNQSDMEMTKLHTVAVENPLHSAHITYPVTICSQVSAVMTSCDQGNTYVHGEINRTRPPAEANDGLCAKSVDPLILKPIIYKELSMAPDPKDTTMAFSVIGKGIELTKLQGNSVLVQRSKDLLNWDETDFPNEQSMDITKVHETADVSPLDNHSCITSTSIVVIQDPDRAVGVKVSGELIAMEQKGDDRNEPMEELEPSRRKSYASSFSMSEKSGIFLEGLENEPSRVHTNSIDVSLLKSHIGLRDNAETDLILDNESDISVFVDYDSSFGNRILPNVAPHQNSIFQKNSCVRSACEVESLDEDNVPDKRGYENGLQSQFEITGKNLKMTGGVRSDTTLNCVPSCLASDLAANVRSEEQKTCILPAETLTSAAQKDSEVALEKMREAKLKGKRVSFHVPEIEIVAKDVTLGQVTEPFVSQRQKYDDVEHNDRMVHATDQITIKSDFMGQELVMGMMQDTENLEDNPLHKHSDVISDMAVVFPERISSNVAVSSELSQNSTGKRRSIADIQLKIQSLSQKSKISQSHTAPVSSLIEQLPPASQTLDPAGSEQVLLNAEQPNTDTTQEKEPIHDKNKTITRENYLTNRLHVKMLQPKLPKKRALSTSNVEPVKPSVSGPEHQNAQCSKTLLKTFKAIDDGQRIDEEILPVCPDDHEFNNVFDYDVPEGAWEELCQEEAVQQNLDRSTVQCTDAINGQKRVRDTEDDSESQREKRARWKGDILKKDDAQNSEVFKGSDKSYRSDSSTHHASKTMEQTYYTSSSQDSRGDGMSVELSSQHCSQMDSQLPWDTGCEQNLWQKFQDGTITVQEFFVLLRIRILIQKPRYSELPSKLGMTEDLTASETLLNQYVYQPKLQMYEEESHTLYQKIEELKVSTELQHKPLVQINSLLWEALRMCSENELMYFGMTLKNMKSLYSKKSKRIAHEEKASTYSKLLRTAQTQCEDLQARLNETDKLLGELDDCISSLETETGRLNKECGNESPAVKSCVQIQAEIDCLNSKEQLSIRENLELEKRKQQVLEQLDSLQEEERVNDKRFQELGYTEWELVKWTDKAATFIFLYESLELSIAYGDHIDGEYFNNQPCRKISSVMVESQLDDAVAPPSSVLVHRLILQYVEKGAFHKTYKNQKNLPQLLSNLSLVVSRCRLLGEELEYLIKWGAKYNIVKTQVQSLEVKLLFSSLRTLVKFELIIPLSDTYPTAPLAFTLNNLIGSVANSRVTAIMSKVPTGLWYLTRTVKSIHENLLL